MTRDDILEQHYAKARGDMAIVWAFLPVAISIFVIIFAASIGRPKAGAMLYALLCAAPLLAVRQGLFVHRKPLLYAVGLILPGAAGYLATGTLWTAVVTAALGLATVALYYFKRDDVSYKPKLSELGQTRLNADLQAAGFQGEVF